MPPIWPKKNIFGNKIEKLCNFRVDISIKISLIFSLTLQRSFYFPHLSPPDGAYTILVNFFYYCFTIFHYLFAPPKFFLEALCMILNHFQINNNLLNIIILEFLASPYRGVRHVKLYNIFFATSNPLNISYNIYEFPLSI